MDENIILESKPFSKNPIVTFFQKIKRWWLGIWYNFADKHPKGAKVIYQLFFFIIFSQGVTIYQILLLIFLPYLFGIELAGTAFMWPNIILPWGASFNILGYQILKDTSGAIVIGGGLGYFIAFEIAVFTAQCINFPLQRNITFKSKGNFWYQAMWYFIGWVLISLFCNALNSLWLGVADFMPYAIKAILAMVVQGGIAMVIFYFIFLVIFPDVHKMSDRAANNELKKKAIFNQYQKAGDKVKLQKAEKEYNRAMEEAKRTKKLSNIAKANKDIASIKSICEAKISQAIALQKAYIKAKAESSPKLTEIKASMEKAETNAFAEIKKREIIVAQQQIIIDENR